MGVIRRVNDFLFKKRKEGGGVGGGRAWNPGEICPRAHAGDSQSYQGLEIPRKNPGMDSPSPLTLWGDRPQPSYWLVGFLF